jgi:hypothetical protein
MIAIMIPFLQEDMIVGAYIHEYFFEPLGDEIVNDFTTILDDEN